MKLTVIGTGYVGLVSGVCFAQKGHQVVCVDKDERKIARLNNGQSPIYEPGIEEMISRNMEEGRLRFSVHLATAVRFSDIIIIAVGTPSSPNGEADLSQVYDCAAEIGQAMDRYKIIVTKSTVPVGTNENIRSIIASHTDLEFDIASVPEFLREGTAIEDTLHPDRIIIGMENKMIRHAMIKLHHSFTENIRITDIRSAEMIKYASNAFLATKISFINEIANICERVGADVTEVAAGMGMDKRIGASFLQAGIGYGGSCFPKDTKALIQIAGNFNYEFKLLHSVVEVNTSQRNKIVARLQETLPHLNGAHIAIWGLAFKPDTDDIRDAPAFDIVETLLRMGAKLRLYDPIAADNFRAKLDHANIHWSQNAMEAVYGCDAVCLLTDWQEFKDADLHRVSSYMKRPLMIDGRNVYNRSRIEGSGLEYYSIGRPRIRSAVSKRSAI